MQTNYYDRPEISHSDLMLIDKSIEHFLRKKQMPRTKPMGLGSAFHCYMSERHKFNDEFIVKPEGLALNTIEGMLWKEFNLIERYENRDLINLVIKNWFNPSEFDLKYIAKPNDIKLNTAEGKKWKSEHESFTIISEKDMEIVKSFKLDKDILAKYLENIRDKEIQYINADKIIVNFDEFEWIKIVVDKVLAHPLAYLFEGNNVKVEHEIYYEYMGIKRRGKLDKINYSRRIIFDFKSIDDCEKAEKKAFWEHSTQGFDYQNGILIIEGELHDFILVYVEKKFPYGVKFVKLTRETLNHGKIKVDSAIDKYKNYLSNPEQYTGYSETLIEV